MRIRYERLASGWFDYLFLSIAELDELLDKSAWVRTTTQERGADYAVRIERR